MAKFRQQRAFQRGQPCGVFCSWAQGNMPAPLSSSPSLVGLSIIGLPHSLGSADGPTLREAADEEFIWADMQRKTIDSFELVKPISSIQNIIQRLAR